MYILASNQIKKKPFSPSDSEADEPLLDLESGKMSKKNDFLAQLFGDQPSKPETNGLVSKENVRVYYIIFSSMF